MVQMDYQPTEPRKLKNSNGVVNGDDITHSHPNSNETEGELVKRNNLPKPPFQSLSLSPVMSEPSAALIDQVGHKFKEVFQLKQGGFIDLPTAKISEMMKFSSLDNAPTQSLLSVVNGILDESIEKRNGEIPHRVACLLRKVVFEVERRISTQAEHLRTQNSLIRTREEKYQSRIKLLQTLASVPKETEPLKSRLQVTEKGNDEDVKRLVKEKEEKDQEVLKLKQELQTRSNDLKSLIEMKEEKELQISKLKQEFENIKSKDVKRLIEEKEEKDREISTLKRELQNTRSEEDMKTLLIEEKEGKDQQISTLKQEIENVRTKDMKRLIEEKEEKDKEISTLKRELQNATKSEEDVKTLLIEEKEGKNQEISTLKQEIQNIKSAYESRCLHLETKSRTAQEEFEERKREFDNLLADSRNKTKEIQEYSASKQKQLMDFQFNFGQRMRCSCESIKMEILKCGKSYQQDINQLGVMFKSQAEAVANYQEVIAENRKLFNEIQELRGNIRVFCRVRPFHPGQKERKSTLEHIGEHGELVLANPNKQGKEGHRSFKFNKVYGPSSTQVEVYKDVQPLVRSVLDGYNVCIFAYGQTGSGKTYTMTGPNGATEETLGVNYRALNDLFNISKKRTESSTAYDVGVQVVEIYNEQVRDLLSSDSSQKNLGISSRPRPDGLAVPDASMFPVESTANVMELMEVGFKNRAVSSTAMNERSSRSHSVVSIHVRGRDLKTGTPLHGNLHLVDLAGSERVDRSEVTGDRLREAQHINKSLSALGDVIFALAQKSQHVPYRNSKLTQLLQTSLGGQAKTLMFVQLNPDVNSYSETFSTLKFAERVSGVELGAAKSNKENSNVRELMEQIASLKDTVGKRDEEIERLHLLKDLTNVTSPVSDRSPTPSPRKDAPESAANKIRGSPSAKGTGPKEGETSGYGDYDNEDRLSDMSSENGNSTGTEAESEASKSTDQMERKNSVSKIVRSLQKKTDSPSPSTKRTPSSSSSLKARKG